MLLIGCYTPPRGEGAGVVRALPDGRTDLVAALPSPSFLARHPTLPTVYATDTDSCHVAVCGAYLVTTQYSAGTAAVHRLHPDGSIGPRTDHRAGFVHPHMAVACPDGDGVLIADLGRDSVDRFRFDTAGRLVPQAAYAVPGGPRHFLRHGSRWYAVSERSGTLTVLSSGWRTLSVHPGLTTPSELAVSAYGFLYAANRGPDTISVFAVDEGEPRWVAEVPSGGRWPRHLAISGDLLFVAHQESHEVTTMRIDSTSGIPSVVESTRAPSASCVLPMTGIRRTSRVRILAPPSAAPPFATDSAADVNVLSRPCRCGTNHRASRCPDGATRPS